MGLDRLELDVDHVMLNKFAGPEDRSFLRVSKPISGMCQRASEVLKKRKTSKAGP